MFDTGMNKPESVNSLLYQRDRLTAGKRHVQMFPKGTPELPLPATMRRIENERGVFHYNPAEISSAKILELSAVGRENVFLELGPYSKSDVLQRMAAGERLTAISEYTPGGVEVRTAAATETTLPAQRAYFEQTKDSGNHIAIRLPDRARI